MKPQSAFSDSNLAFCLLLPSLILFPNIPQWAFYSSIIFWFYRIMIDKMEWTIPSRVVTGGFSLIFLGITYMSYDSLIGREPSCAFLVVLLSLKILEYRKQEENGFLILLGFYLVTTKFLFDTHLIWFSVGFPTMILFIYFLLPPKYRQTYKSESGLYVLRTLLLSFPLTAFLFFYFPRFSNDLFHFKMTEGKAHGVGFAEDVQPGSVSSLIQNDEVVLRAKFINHKPTINSLYWRGLVLTEQEGMQWRRDKNIEKFSKPSPPFSESDTYVNITLEPTYKNWIFSLDQTTELNSSQRSIFKLPMGIYKSEDSIDTRVIYQLRSKPLLARPRDKYESRISIKETASPQVKKLMTLLSKSNKATPDDIINNFSLYLVNNHFRYTLSPGDQGLLTLDDFLFKTKQGFCEHYASATAILLNYLKIPARVVAGYHGGEYNPIGDFWTLRQRDAHAWIEYLNNNNEWKRFDPTAVIAPMRLNLGANDFAKSTDQEILASLGSFRDSLAEDSLLQKAIFFAEDLNYRWNAALVNFDLEKQKNLLEAMNISIPEAIIYGMLSTLILSLSLSWLLRNRRPISRSHKIFQLINSHFEPYGLERRIHEGPETWRDRIIQSMLSTNQEALAIPFHRLSLNQKHEQQKLKIKALFDCYITEAYKNNSMPSNLSRAKQILRQL